MSEEISTFIFCENFKSYVLQLPMRFLCYTAIYILCSAARLSQSISQASYSDGYELDPVRPAHKFLG